jgi:hypothetical protein
MEQARDDYVQAGPGHSERVAEIDAWLRDPSAD